MHVPVRNNLHRPAASTVTSLARPWRGLLAGDAADRGPMTAATAAAAATDALLEAPDDLRDRPPRRLRVLGRRACATSSSTTSAVDTCGGRCRASLPPEPSTGTATSLPRAVTPGGCCDMGFGRDAARGAALRVRCGRQ